MNSLSLKNAVLIGDKSNGFFAWSEDQDDADEYINDEIFSHKDDEGFDETESRNFFIAMSLCDAIKGDYLTPEKLSSILTSQPK